MTTGFVFKKAERKKVKLKIGVSGTSGSGKTYSALLLARGLASDWSKVAMIDTENDSGSLYEHLGNYVTASFPPPFSAERHIAAIEAAERAGFEVLIIDSFSALWDGQGGIKELAEKLGGRFQDWAKAKQQHKKVVDRILQSPMHCILATRKKTDWVVEVNDKGKSSPRKVGLKDVQAEGMEYEWSIGFNLNNNHLASVDKDRTGVFKDRFDFTITEDTGRTLLAWTNSGKEGADAGASQTSAPVTAISASQELAKDPAIEILFDKLEGLEGKTIDSHKRFLGVHARAGDADQRGAVIAGLEKKISVMAAKQQSVQV